MSPGTLLRCLHRCKVSKLPGFFDLVNKGVAQLEKGDLCLLVYAMPRSRLGANEVLVMAPNGALGWHMSNIFEAVP